MLANRYEWRHPTLGAQREKEDFINASARLMAWQLGTWPGKLLMIGVIILAIGVYTQIRVLGMTRLVDVSIEELERGHDPGSEWLFVTGTALPDAAAGVKVTTTRYYVPIVSNTVSRNGVAAYLSVSLQQLTMLRRLSGRQQFSGIVEDDLPGMTRVGLERSGFGPRDEYIVIDFEDTPDSRRTATRIFLWGGGALTAVSAVWICLIWRLRQRTMN